MLTVFAAAALLSAAGCKKKESVDERDRTGMTNRETQARRGTDLDRTPGTQARARATYANDMHERLTRIDSKIEELDRSPDPSKRDEAARAKVKRNELSRKLDMARDTTSDRWDDFKKDVDDGFKSLEKDLDIK
jgi:hypothetical protein